MAGQRARKTFALMIGGALVTLFLVSLLLDRNEEARAAYTQSWTIALKEEYELGTLNGVSVYPDYLELTPASGYTSINPATGADLRDAVMLSGFDTRAVSSDGKILHWNGTSWTTAYSATTNALYSLSMVSAGDGWAVGANRIVRYAGGSWASFSTSPTGATLYAVDMVNTNSGWAVGVDGNCALNNCNIIAWNGTGWSAFNSPTNLTMYGLDMASNVDGWAVGDQGKIIRWNGSKWNNWNNPNGTNPTNNGRLYSVSMATPARGWAVGVNGMIIEWDGVNWKYVNAPTNPLAGDPTVTFYRVKAVSETNVWALGVKGTQGVVLHWNGTQWSAVSLGITNLPTMYGIALYNDGAAGVMVGAAKTAIKFGGYCPGGGTSCSGTATYTFDAGQPVTWESHSFVADTTSGVTSVGFKFAGSTDGVTWSSWYTSVYGMVYQHMKQEITLSTTDWTRTPRLHITTLNFTTATDTGPNWIPKAGPHDVRTWVYSNKVLVLFTAKTGAGDITYTVYRHAYEQDRTAVALGWVKTDTNGQITDNWVAGAAYAWNGSDPWFPGWIVFTDTAVQNFKEYYYYVTDGAYTGDLRDYIVASAFPPTQTRHGNFTDQTNACNGCHGLHSSPSRFPGRGKLWKAPTAVDLCRSCHDGSGSKYDETNGRVRLDVTWSVYANALAGPYGSVMGGVLVDVNPTSVHNVGMAIVNQAPGSGAPWSPPSWISQLSCISCHEPHNKFRNYRILRGAIHSGKHVRVRAFSEVNWTAADKSDGAMYQEYIGGIGDFCAQCHVYFLDEQVGLMDKRPSNPTVAANVYGNHRHVIKIQPAFYTQMGKKTVAMDTYAYSYPFEDADPARQLLPNQDLPLEGTYTVNNYVYNTVVCLTCHMAHGTTKTGQKQVAYLNGDYNNTAGASKMDRYGGYTDRYNALNNLAGGGSTVLMRADGVGVCQRCHQKSGASGTAYIPKQWYWNGSSDVWCDQATACGGGFVDGAGVP